MIEKQPTNTGITSNTTLEKYRAEIHRIPGTPEGDAYLAKQYETATDPIFKMIASTEINERGRIRSAMRAAKEKEQQQGQPQLSIADEKLQALRSANQEDQMAAQQEEMANTGIAQLPIAPDMFQEPQGMAAGGIVAFENGGGVSDRWKAIASDPTPYYAEDFRRDAAEFFDPVVAFFTNREGRQRKAARELKRAQDMQTADQPGDYPMYKPRPVAKAPLADPTMGENKNTAPTGKAEPAKANADAGSAKSTDPYEELKALFKEQAAERAGARKEARDLSILETGLAMMGGTSPYAFENIGKAGAQGAKSYQERIAGLRKEDREGRRDYADVIKGQADYGQRERTIGIQQQAADTQRLIANKTPDQIALVERYAREKKVPFDVALQEVYGARHKEDPIAAMIAEQIRGGDGKNIDRTSLAKSMERWKNDYGITPTK
jgi:hypothetical protein